ncbi:MAG: polysaccharide biosynthesis/export family protein [Chloracidobacterium sp.]|nr:polysaccharide biosynthesis/export family protein [Chloracidobacterium sp.]
MNVRCQNVINIAFALTAMAFTTVPAFSQVSLVNMADRYVASGGAHPSTLHRIGAHDLLKIEIVNANVRPRILRVGGDGCIVFPLAGEDVCIAGKTAGEAEAQIASAIKLFERTAIKIEVLDRTSHVVNIAGLVDQPGEQQIMRDAVPFFVVRAGLTLNRAAKRCPHCKERLRGNRRFRVERRSIERSVCISG